MTGDLSMLAQMDGEGATIFVVTAAASAVVIAVLEAWSLTCFVRLIRGQFRNCINLFAAGFAAAILACLINRSFWSGFRWADPASLLLATANLGAFVWIKVRKPKKSKLN